MKKFNLGFIILMSLTVLLSTCEKVENTPTEGELIKKLLTTKSGGWTNPEVDIPVGSATLPEDWINFKAVFDARRIITSGHAPGAEAVWPSSEYVLNEQGNEITRLADGIVMTIESSDEQQIIVSFEVPEGVTASGRTKVLKGKYKFTLR